MIENTTYKKPEYNIGSEVYNHMYDCMVHITKIRYNLNNIIMYEGIIDYGDGKKTQVFREFELSDYEM